MRAALESLRSAKQRLEEELELYDAVSSAVASERIGALDTAQNLSRRARRSLYVSVVIGCYGLVEETVDLLLAATVESYSDIYSTHGDLPQAVRTNYRDLLLRCLSERDRARTRNPVDERTAISALLADSGDAAALLSAVFTHATANYRIGQVRDMFRRIGVDLDDRLKPQDSNALDALGFSSYGSFLDDLVLRRNELAHSYSDDGILDRQALEQVVRATVDFLESLTMFVGEDILLRLTGTKLVPAGQVVRYWSGRIGVVLSAGEIALTDRVAVVKGLRTAIVEVESLMSNGVEERSFRHVTSPLDVSIGTTGAAEWMENGLAYVLPPNWSNFW